MFMPPSEQSSKRFFVSSFPPPTNTHHHRHQQQFVRATDEPRVTPGAIGSARRLSSHCIERTGVSQSQVDGAQPLPAVLLLFHRWLESQSLLFKRLCFITMGDWTLGSMLPGECQRKNIPLPSVSDVLTLTKCL